MACNLCTHSSQMIPHHNTGTKKVCVQFGGDATWRQSLRDAPSGQRKLGMTNIITKAPSDNRFYSAKHRVTYSQIAFKDHCATHPPHRFFLDKSNELRLDAKVRIVNINDLSRPDPSLHIMSHKKPLKHCFILRIMVLHSSLISDNNLAGVGGEAVRKH